VDIPHIESFGQYFTNDVIENINYSKRKSQRIEQPKIIQTKDIRLTENLKQEILLFNHFEKWEFSKRIEFPDNSMKTLEFSNKLLSETALNESNKET
jgi:hypothetical protein